MGSDTFSVSGGASGHGSIPRNDVKARESAYQTAQAHCSKISKNMLVNDGGSVTSNVSERAVAIPLFMISFLMISCFLVILLLIISG